MKTKKLRLTELSKKELSQRQMSKIKAGDNGYNWCTEKCGTLTQDRDYTGGLWYDYFYGPFPN